MRRKTRLKHRNWNISILHQKMTRKAQVVVVVMKILIIEIVLISYTYDNYAGSDSFIIFTPQKNITISFMSGLVCMAKNMHIFELSQKLTFSRAWMSIVGLWETYVYYSFHVMNWMIDWSLSANWMLSHKNVVCHKQSYKLQYLMHCEMQNSSINTFLQPFSDLTSYFTLYIT